MVRTSARSVGTNAEQIAFLYLRKQGLQPVRRNFRCRRGELDLIMLDAAVLVFVEVRYRTQSSFVESTLTVDARKQNKLLSTAAIFLAKNPEHYNSVCRFDVVGIDQDRHSGVSINWVQDAFRPLR